MGYDLLERDAVLQTATQALRAAARGEGGTLVIRGDAGTGKTSVLEAVRQKAEDFTVAYARGEEMESGLPFAVLDRLLHAAGADADPDDPDQVLERSVPHVLALGRLRRLASSPLLLLLDDLHWADADSLTAITFLARRLDGLPVLLVAAVRPWPARPAEALAGLVADGHAVVHELGPLSEEAGRRLLAARAGIGIDDPVARQAQRDSGGNPLLLSHVAAVLARGEDPASPAAGPDGLLLRRFAGLDPEALTLARAGALLGVSFPPAVALGLAGLPPERGVPSLDALSRSGVVAPDGVDHLRFAHPLLRQALYDDLAPGVRQQWHADAFAELVRRGRAAEAAEHAIRADLGGDVEAAAVLERVGRAALAAGAVEVAVGRLEAAARFLGDGAGATLLLTLAEALCATGRAEAGAERCRQLLLLPAVDWRTRVQALLLLGRCAYLGGEPDRGATETERAVELALQHDETAAIEPLLEQVVSTWLASGPRAALPLAARAREIAVRTNADPALRQTVEADHGSLRVETGDPEGRMATRPFGRLLSSPTREASLPAAELVSPRSPLYPFAHCEMYAEQFDTATAAFDLAGRRLATAGAADASATLEIFRSNLLLRRGRLHEALEAADRAGRYTEFTPVVQPVVAGLRSLVLTWLGREPDARAARAQATADGEVAWPIRAWTAFGDGLRALWVGDPAASDAFLVVERTLEEAGVGEPNHTPFAAHAVAAHLLVGREDDAHRVVERLAPAAARHPGRWPRHAVVLSRARMAERAGRTAEALSRFDEAVEVLGDVDQPLTRAEALLAAGAARRRAGEPLRARPALAQALRLAEEHGARPLAALATNELRLAGGRRRRAGEDRDRLTAAELRVARAAAHGRTNAEIAAGLHLSPNTVASHLKRVFGKLGITSRHELTVDRLQGEDAVRS